MFEGFGVLMTLTDSFTVTFTINLKGIGEGLVLLDNGHGTKVKTRPRSLDRSAR